jgi:hypothetical protein
VSNTPGDLTYVCVYQHFTYCSPCIVNDDCKSPLIQSSDNRCVARDDNSGSFCGTSCGTNADCPEGGQCDAVVIDGESRNLCLPTSGVCECSEFAINSGATTTCLSDNPDGACEGLRTCTAAGLSECDAMTPSLEVCNGIDDDCNGVTDDVVGDMDNDGLSDCVDDDADGDGFSPPEDCNDFNGDVHPNADEYCNSMDDNCDNVVDEENSLGCSSFYQDSDGDNYGSDVSKCLCDVEGAFNSQVTGDCNDGNNAIHPGAAEVCNNIDDNCDNVVDGEASGGCTTFFLDQDGDGHGIATDSQCLCQGTGNYTALAPDDCNDLDPANFPGNVEICDNKDNNCDNVVDGENLSGCQSYYLDVDGDNWGTSNAKCLCGPSSTHGASQPGDCDDGNPWVNPAAQESCNTPFDDDCDGNTDTPQDGSGTNYYVDNDGDGYGSGAGMKLCAPTATHSVTVSGDCNDGATAINPGAPELCNGTDDDCDLSVDEQGAVGCVTFYLDNDDDGHGLAFNSQCLCNASGNYTAFLPDDCNDSDNSIYPGNDETCDAKDNDCDDSVDEGLTQACSSACGAGVESCFFGFWTGCSAPNPITCTDYDTCASVSTCSGACNSAPEEVCDGIDNDCDSETDEGFTGDYSNGGLDFKDTWPGSTLSSYPSVANGTVFGHIIPQGDNDWWSVYAVEDNSDGCFWPWDSDNPIKAEIQFTSPCPATGCAWYIVCACWSSATEKCGLSDEVCETSVGTNVNITVNMTMDCGNSDSGYLDVEVKPHTTTLDYHCADWIALWAISE